MNWSDEVVGEVMPATVTVTCTAPAEPAGLTTVHELVVLQVTEVPAVVPKSTVLAPEVVEKPVPVMVTVVPPAVDPEVGLILVTVGAVP